MDWWQIILIILTAIVAGLLVGGLISYLIARLLKKPFVIRHEMATVVAEQREFTVPGPIAKVESKSSMLRLLKKPFVKKPETTAVVAEQQKLAVPGLLAEVEGNLGIASKPWTGELLSFQTQVWDANQDGAHRLPADLRENITQAYVDIRLANSIVWLSTEIGHRSQTLDENYMKMCTNIAERLDRITTLLKRSGD